MQRHVDQLLQSGKRTGVAMALAARLRRVRK